MGFNHHFPLRGSTLRVKADPVCRHVPVTRENSFSRWKSLTAPEHRDHLHLFCAQFAKSNTMQRKQESQGFRYRLTCRLFCLCNELTSIVLPIHYIPPLLSVNHSLLAAQRRLAFLFHVNRKVTVPSNQLLISCGRLKSAACRGKVTTGI